MKRQLPLLLLFLFGACTDEVEVTIVAPSSNWEVYGEDTIQVSLHPYRNVALLELLIDSVVAGADTYPGPTSSFVWNVAGLREAGVHRVQARATSGSREYLSAELTATVGYRSRLLLTGAGETLRIHHPDGRRDKLFVPMTGAGPVCPRFRPGCKSVVFLWNRKLYASLVPTGQAQPLDSVENGIFNCDASPVSNLVAFDGLPAATAHIFTKDGTNPRVQITHDSDFVIIDSSRFTCTSNLDPVFSPDGSKLVYRRDSRCLVPGDPHEGESRLNVFVMNRDGSSPLNLTPGLAGEYFSGFTWTFDGKWVLFLGVSRTLAANLSGQVLTIHVSQGLPPAMACSPTDSTLIYIDPGDHRLRSTRLVWTADTIYTSGENVLTMETFGNCIDWVEYSGQ